MADYRQLIDLGMNDILKQPEFAGLLSKLTEDERLETLFEATIRATAWITDDDEAGHSIFVFDTNGVNKDKLLVVHNPAREEIYLWKIDGVLFKRYSKCDCAVVRGDVLHLVEFKANALNESEASIEGNYDKACNQLILTLQYLEDAYKRINKDINDVFSDIDALIVFDRIVPQNNAYQKSVSARFSSKTTRILTYGNDLTV